MEGLKRGSFMIFYAYFIVLNCTSTVIDINCTVAPWVFEMGRDLPIVDESLVQTKMADLLKKGPPGNSQWRGDNKRSDPWQTRFHWQKHRPGVS